MGIMTKAMLGEKKKLMIAKGNGKDYAIFLGLVVAEVKLAPVISAMNSSNEQTMPKCGERTRGAR